MEDTGLTRAERISTLLTVVSVAFVCADVTGDLLATKVDVQIMNHGDRAVSVFQFGLNHLPDLLLHPSLSLYSLASLMPRVEGESTGVSHDH